LQLGAVGPQDGAVRADAAQALDSVFHEAGQIKSRCVMQACAEIDDARE